MLGIAEKRKRKIINIIYFIIVIGLFYVAFTTFSPLIAPFVMAFITASIFNKPISAIEKKTPLKRPLLSVIAVLLMVAVIAAIFFFAGIGLIGKLKEFVEYLMAQFQNTDMLVNNIKLWILDFTSFLPENARTVLHENVTIFFDNILEKGVSSVPIDTSAIDWGSLITKGGQVLTGTVAKIPSFIIAFIVYLISTAFIASDYERIKKFFLGQFSPEKSQKIIDACALGISSLKKMLKAYGLIILITTSELTVGMYILKFLKIFDNPYIIFIAFGIALIDIIPVLGTGTVLIPWGIISLLSGKISLGVGLLIIYVIILVIRQIIEPKLVAGQVGLPPIATIVAMYIGSKTLGILGFFILPFIVILIKVYNDAGIIHLFKDPNGEHQSADETSSDAVSDNIVEENVNTNE